MRSDRPSTDPSARTDGRAAYVSPETRFADLGPVELERGGTLPDVRVGYRTWGTLAPDGANAVIVCHALTGSADADLWWSRMFGPGAALDLRRDFVVCSNILGSCYGTTGPISIDPATGKPWLGTFPEITVRDMVNVQRALADRLGLRRIRAVIGGSLGGMQALEWALMDPDRVESLVFVASSARHSAWCIGLSEAQRQAIFADPRWRDGRYDPEDPPSAGLAAARMMAMCSYRSAASFEERFARRAQDAETFAVESYLRYQGRQLVARFDAATYVTLTRAMDTHDVARGRGDLDDVLRSIRMPTLVVSIESDVLYPPSEQREVARLVPGARLAVIDSPHGHDAFLIDVERLSSLVADFRRRNEAFEVPQVPSVAVPEEARSRGVAPAEHGLSLLVLGKGKVGAELLEQLRVQRGELERDYDVVLRVAGVADRGHAVLAEEGVDLDRWREALAGTPAGPVDARTAPALLDALARLPGPMLVDLTAADGMEEVYEQAFRRGIDVVSANKRPLTVGLRRLDALHEVRRQRRCHWHYETAVGASLPVIATLRRLRETGDRILAIEGSLSGTLGYVCTELMKGVPLSLAVRWAIGLGYAEEDPREDLLGMDSARKALILARELALPLSLDDVRVEPLIPPEWLAPGPVDALLAELRLHDDAMAARVEAIRRDGRALRVLAHVEPGARPAIRVGPEAVEASHPAARLVGVEAFVAFTTARHSERPLVVQGTGVGGASTAGAVLAEIFRIAGKGAR